MGVVLRMPLPPVPDDAYPDAATELPVRRLSTVDRVAVVLAGLFCLGVTAGAAVSFGVGAGLASLGGSALVVLLLLLEPWRNA